MKKFLFLSILTVLGLSALSIANLDEPAPKTYVVISTEYGDIKALLYDETPFHRDNFVKNVREGVYDSLLFHRVIKNFMIQGGDPDSKKAKEGDVLGSGGLNYTVKAEFNKNLIHKRGALCAAREGDDVNPTKASSSTQFYIVQGQVYTDESLKKMEARINQMAQNTIFFELLNLPENATYLQTFKEAMTAKDEMKTMEIYMAFRDKILEKYQANGGDFKFSDEQKEIYKTQGGAAHLDGSYTVFGEVVSGMEVVDKIAEETVDGNSRPLKDMRFTIKIVYE